MPILLLRHGQKKWNNTARMERGFDPPLDPSQFPDMDYLWRSLLSLGEPDSIVASPYLRTRQTARLVCHNLGIADFSVDSRLSEFLGHQSRADTCSDRRLDYLLSESTRGYLPALILDKGRYMRAAQRFPLEDSCWYITHGLFIGAVASEYGLALDRPREFTGLIIEGQSARVFDPWAT